METIQNLIIGFGKGGKTLAKSLAAKGEKVVVIEKDAQMYGGTCINVGCIPSKALITQGLKQRSFTVAAENKTALINKLRNKNYHMLADDPNIQVVDGTAKFVSDHQVRVQTTAGKEVTYEAERIFINTGATAVIPEIAGLKLSEKVGTSKELMALTTKPEHLVILGAGYIGLEFASMFASFGSKVTVIDPFATFLPREDRSFAEMIQQDLTEKGIEFVLGTNIQSIQETQQVSVALADGRIITGDYLLVATGRKPNTDQLGLENTAIKVNERGAVVVDEKLQTTVANVWALGDVTGGLQFTYISLDDYRIVENQLFGDQSRTTNNRPAVPYSVFIEPPISHVGLHEYEAQKQGLDYKKFVHLNANVPKAHILENAKGMFQVLVDRQTDFILGATIYGAESHEVINLLTLAMNVKASYQVLKNQIYTHPTMSEALNDVLK